MPSQPLHPNLARLAAEYDNIIERFSQHRINGIQARAEILALIARDDNGTQWSLDPDTGKWCYRNIRGQLVEADPPAYGLATPTAHDLSRNPNAFNPDAKIQFQEVDESLMYPPNSLLGSTRRPIQVQRGKVASFLLTSKGKMVVLVALIAAAVVALLVINPFSHPSKSQSPSMPPASSMLLETLDNYKA